MRKSVTAPGLAIIPYGPNKTLISRDCELRRISQPSPYGDTPYFFEGGVSLRSAENISPHRGAKGFPQSWSFPKYLNIELSVGTYTVIEDIPQLVSEMTVLQLLDEVDRRLKAAKDVKIETASWL